MARSEELDLARLITNLKDTRREVAYMLAVLQATETGLDELLETCSEAGTNEGLADVASWAHRTCLAAESAADLLVDQARCCNTIAECASGPGPRKSSH